ncbi:hypothetical protein [Paraburkholderia tropica]|uniref:hypothetical protein n=1 Tax=Paraburkholderia tropica TaxID=92647 RepID=UPI002AB2E93E|nr:hypothetical protein [Paraburkholderia tropica]
MIEPEFKSRFESTIKNVLAHPLGCDEAAVIAGFAVAVYAHRNEGSPETKAYAAAVVRDVLANAKANGFTQGVRLLTLFGEGRDDTGEQQYELLTDAVKGIDLRGLMVIVAMAGDPDAPTVSALH